MSKNLSYLSVIFTGLALYLTGCAEVPIQVGDGKMEKTLTQVTGLAPDAAEMAAVKKTMNLWDVYALAAKRTESLATSAENVLQAKSQNAQAIGAWLPQVGLNGTAAWTSGSYVGSGAVFSLANPPTDSLYLSGTETIFSGLTQVAAVKGAGANIDVQKYALLNQSRLLLLNVASAFYNVLALEESDQALTTSKDLNEKTLALEKKWQKMGRSRTADVSNTQAQLMQVDADLESDRNQLVQARETLATLANIKPDQILISNETYNMPSHVMDRIQSLVDDRPDVKSAAANVAVSDAYLLQAHGEHLPTLQAQGTYYLDNEGSVPSPEWTVGLTASLPLFEGGQIVAQEDQAASKKRQAEMQLSLARRSAQDDIREANKSLVESIGETAAYQKAVHAYQQDYQDVMHDLKLNLTTNLELLQTLSSLENAKISFIKAKYQTLYDQVWLDVATGKLPKTGNN